MTTEEFESLLSIHGNDIYRFCMHITLNKENADDLYQDTVLTAFRKADAIKLGNNPKSYLLSVAVKLAHNAFRKEKRHKEKNISSSEELYAEIADGTDIQSSTEDIAMKKALRNAVSFLDEKYRIPIILYYFDEHGVQFISNIMKIPQGTVKSRLHKARELIAKTLREEGFTNE